MKPPHISDRFARWCFTGCSIDINWDMASVELINQHCLSKCLCFCSVSRMFLQVIQTVFPRPWGRFKNAYKLINLRAVKFSLLNKLYIFQCMGKIFCVEFQRVPLKFHTQYFTHTLKDIILYNVENLSTFRFKSLCVFLKCPPDGAINE